jgi:hypothetical protein
MTQASNPAIAYGNGNYSFIQIAITGNVFVTYTAIKTPFLSTAVGAAPSFPTGGSQTQQLQIQPNTGNNTTYQWSSKSVTNPNDYNWSPITPGGSLTASVLATVTFGSFCPLGVSGLHTVALVAPHLLWISGGTGTAESVYIQGGTCTGDGLTPGTIIFTPANNHSGPWTVGPDTGGAQEAGYSSGGGIVQLPSGVFNTHGTLFAYGFSVTGQGQGETFLNAVFNNADVIQFSNNGSGAELSATSMTIQIDPSLTATSAFWGIDAIGVSMNIRRMTFRTSYASNVNGGGHILLNDATNSIISGIKEYGHTIGIQVGTTSSGSATGVTISDVIASTVSNVVNTAWLLILNGQVSVSNIISQLADSTQGSSTHVRIAPTGSNFTQNCLFNTMQLDGGSNADIYITGTTSAVQDISFTHIRMTGGAYQNRAGIVVTDGANIDFDGIEQSGISPTSFAMTGNVANLFTGVDSLTINAMKYLDPVAPVSADIQINGGSQAKITNSIIGFTSTGAQSPNSAIAIDFASAAIPYVSILDNDLYGTTAAINDLPTDQSTWLIANSPGYNPVGVFTLTCSASPCTLPATVRPTAATLYLAGGTVSSVTRGGSTVCTSSPCAVAIPAGKQAIITYSGVPTTITLDVQ